VNTELSTFVAFWAGSSLYLAYLAVVCVNSGVIRWGEDAATTIAYSCIFLIIWDLFFPLEYMSVLHEMDDEREDEE
jgi:hypothetical protein